MRSGAALFLLLFLLAISTTASPSPFRRAHSKFDATLSQAPSRLQDQEALVRLYEAAGGADYWQYKWPVDTPESICEPESWLGVKCEEKELNGSLTSVVTSIILGFSDAIVDRDLYIPKEIRHLDYIDTLRLPGLYLMYVEDEILQDLPRLRLLDISLNWFSTLPALPPSLVHLEAHSCRFKSVSTLIGLSKLERLAMSFNPLGSAHVSFSGMASLEAVFMNNCALTSFPSDLKDCPHLRRLHLNINNMNNTSDELCELNDLEELELSDNPIFELPSCLGNPKLSFLRLYDMPNLSSLPTSLSRTKIKSIELKGSPIKDLPSALQKASDLSLISLHDMPLLEYVDPVIFNAPALVSFLLDGAPSFKTVPNLGKVTNARFSSFQLKRTAIREWHIENGTFPKLAVFEISDSLLEIITKPKEVKEPSPLVDNEFWTSVTLSRNKIRNTPAGFIEVFGSFISLLDLSHNPLDPTSTLSCFFCKQFDISFTTGTDFYASCDTNISYSHGPISSLQLSNSVHDAPMVEIDVRGSNVDELVSTGQIIMGDDVKSEPFLEQQLVCRKWVSTDSSLAKIILTPDQVGYVGCLCLTPDQMIFDVNSGKCVPRGEKFPHGLSLSYGEGLLDPIYSIDIGFYPISTSLGLCNTSSPEFSPYSSCKIAKCVTPLQCNPEEKADYNCANGFDPDSLLCSKCPPGSYEAIGHCHTCPSSPYIGIVFNILGVVLVAVVYLRWSFRKDLRHRHGFSSVSLFLSHIQVTSVVVSFVNRIDVKEDESSSSTSFLWFVVSQMFGDINPFILPCVDPHSFSTSVWFLFSLPLFIVLTSVCVCTIASLFKRSIDRSLFHSASLYVTVFLLQFLYVPLSRTTFQLFSCESDPVFGTHLHVAPYISCSDSKYLAMRTAAIISVVLYVVGIPVLLGYVVYRGHPKLVLLSNSEGKDRGTMGSGYGSDSDDGVGQSSSPSRPFPRSPSSLSSPSPLSVSSKDDVFHATAVLLSGVHIDSRPYWTACIISLRKCLVVLPISLLRPHSSFIPLLTLLILQVSLILHVFYRPYYHNFDNILESFFLLLSTITFLTGVASTSNTFEGSNDAYTLILGVNIFVVVMFVVCLPLLRWWRKRNGTAAASLNMVPPLRERLLL